MISSSNKRTLIIMFTISTLLINYFYNTFFKSEIERDIKGISKSPDTQDVLIYKVSDGDTLGLMDGRKIRYIGINAPEKGQPFFRPAFEENKKLVNGKSVRMEYDVATKDRYGRILAYIYVKQDNNKEVMVNEELLRRGLAVVETIQPNVKYQDRLTKAQKYAREQCNGMWNNLCNDTGTNASCLTIESIQADATGDDNQNKNGEWILFRNNCSEVFNPEGYILKDNSAGNLYTFKNISLEPNSMLRLHSGCGTDGQYDIYWGCPESKYSVWNNNGDSAYLYDNNEQLIFYYEY